jgi:hypothetical protein
MKVAGPPPMKKVKRVTPVPMPLIPRSQTALDPGPPPEVLDEIAAAWERAQAPLPDSLELCFASEPGLGRAWGELRLPGGELVTAIAASEAIAIACGDALMALAA